MFFGDALLAKRITSLFATHPPLDDRILRILPHWDGEFPNVRRLGDRDTEERKPRKKGQPPPLPTLPGLPQVPFPILAEEAVNRAGTITPEQMTFAAALLDSVPDTLREAVEEPFGARAAIYCLLLDPNAAIRDRQFERLKAESEPVDYQETVRLSRFVRDLPDAARLPLIDIAIPALRRMSPGQYDVFRRQITQLTMADDCVNTFEFVLRCVLDRYLDANFGLARRSQAMSREVKVRHVATVMSLLAREGHDDEAAARKAYEAGTRHFLRAGDAPPILPPSECGLVQLEEAIQALSGASIGGKRRLLLACAECIAADRQTTVREAELYRAIGEVLGCPIPPLAAPVGKSQ
jgi:hypothetical protein